MVGVNAAKMAAGMGARVSIMDINLTRRMVNAALAGELDGVGYEADPIFKVLVPTSCPGVPDPAILKPVNTWKDKAAFTARARKLAAEFATQFDKASAASCLGKTLRSICLHGPHQVAVKSMKSSLPEAAALALAASKPSTHSTADGGAGRLL